MEVLRRPRGVLLSPDPTQYRSLSSKDCELQSVTSMDIGFAQSPFQALGRRNATILSQSLIGAQSMPGHHCA